MLERIAKDPQAFIRQQGWASVSLDGDHTLMELRSLYEHPEASDLRPPEPWDGSILQHRLRDQDFAEERS